jgi:hypothetical protein
MKIMMGTVSIEPPPAKTFSQPATIPTKLSTTISQISMNPPD